MSPKHGAPAATEPVAWLAVMPEEPTRRIITEDGEYMARLSPGWCVTPLFAAPPAPVSPADCPDGAQGDAEWCEMLARGEDQCAEVHPDPEVRDAAERMATRLRRIAAALRERDAADGRVRALVEAAAAYRDARATYEQHCNMGTSANLGERESELCHTALEYVAALAGAPQPNDVS